MPLALRLKYLINEGYNDYFLRSRRIADSSNIPVTELQTESGYLAHAQPSVAAWLLNINRLIQVGQIDAAQFDFLDVGCGKGIAAIYAKDRFPFRKVAGFDFDKRLTEIACSNRDGARVVGRESIHFYHADAAEIRLPHQRTFCFLFNPFDATVLRLFVNNNLHMLRETGSVIAYANCKALHVLESFSGARIFRITKYNCALVRFT